MLKHLLGGNITCTMSLDPGARPVEVDPSLVEQMIFILAENARDAMPGGGRLAIELKNVLPDDDYREKGGLPGGPADEYVALTVADTGRGDRSGVARTHFRALLYDQARRHRTGPLHREQPS